jgi:polysaccharide biosynthesis/export protein
MGESAVRVHKTILVAIALLLGTAGMLQTCPAQTESLLIGPGDLVQLDVIDTPELEQQVRVSDAGTVTLAFLGEVKVAGQTPSSAAAYITKQFVEKRVMKAPQVTVRIIEYATQEVSILGQVRNPGSYAVTTPQPILKVLALAGGLTDIADRNLTIKRHDTSAKVNYYLANNADQALSDGVLVYPGDIVVVPKAAFIYVMGDVARPGGYAISTNDSHVTVLQAVAMAGSANKTAIQSHVRLIRKTATGTGETAIHLDAIEKGKQPDLPLEADDVLYVPFSWVKNAAVNASTIAASTSSAAIYVLH